MPATAEELFAGLKPVSVAKPAADPFANLTPVSVATAPAPAQDPFAALTPVRASGVYTLPEFEKADEAALTEEKDFSPIEFSVQNKDALLKNPAALEKAIRLYEAKDKRGTTVGEKAGSVVSGVPKVAGALYGGVKAALKKAYELNPVALAARAAGGDAGEARKVAAEFAEVPAAVESGALGTTDLARRAVRGTGEFLTKGLTPEEYRTRFHEDLGYAEQVSKAGQGQGAIAEALGTDAASLAEVGIEVDPQAIQELSVLADPVNYIPVAGTVGFFSKTAAKGGKLGFRVLAKASPAQAAKLAGALNKARQAASLVKEVGGSVAGNVLEGTGKAISKVGAGAEAILSPIAGSATLGGVIAGGLSGAATAVGVAKIAPKLVQWTGESLESLGQVTKGTKTLGPKASAVAKVASEAAKGAAEAGAISLPLFIGARPEEQEVLLGGIGLAAGIRGGLATGKIAGLKAQDRLAESIFRDVERAPTPDSPHYGTDGTLDASHAQAFQALPKNEQTVLNHFRELLRTSGVELYALDQATFESRVPKVSGASRAKGFFTEAGESVSPDGTRKTVARIFLNGDVESIGHELFHAVESVDPQGAKGLIKAVEGSWTPEEQAGFGTYYNTLLNGGKPENLWTSRIKGDGVLREVAAEVFGRALNGFDLSGVSPTVKQSVALFLSGALEKLGVPLASKTQEPGAPGVSYLGIRPSTAEVRGAHGLLSRLSERLNEDGTIIPTESTRTGTPALSNIEPKDVDIGAGIQAKPKTVPLTKPNVEFSRPGTPPPVAPSVISPEVVPVAPRGVRPVPTKPIEVPTIPVTPPARNIRTTPAKQNDFAAQRAEVTNTEKASAAKLTPEVKSNVDAINVALNAGRAAVEIVHSGVKTESSAEAPAGRTSRRAEQEEAYIQEGLSATPQAFRESHQKVFVPVRWEMNSKGPQLIAMSLDKVIANTARVAKDAYAKGAENSLPYAINNGKLTDAAWTQVVKDLKDYSANQANGYRGDGQRLVRPTEDIGASIPVENPDYTPVSLPEEKMNFLNLVQGIAPPLTAREVKAGTPGNVKGQIIAEVNLRTPETPADIRPQDIQKQTFKSGRTVKEMNPLRNELQRAGVDTKELIEVTERINSGDIQSVTQRPDLDISAPVTDIIRGGFLPGKETDAARRAGFLADPTPSTPTPSVEIRSLAESYAKSAGVPYSPSRIFLSVDPDLAKRLADFYDSAVSTPDSPEVAATYEALANEVKAQYDSIVAAGYKLEPYAEEGEPYASSADMVRDVRDNKHLFFYKTEPENFGQGESVPNSRLLQPSGIEIDGQPMLANDLFRGVHDFFGRAKEGYQFGPRGEFNAWHSHSEMFSPEAQGALASETLAQNSWVNYGKHLRDPQGRIAQKGEPGYVAPTERPFADQKNIIIPESLINEARQAAGTESFMPGKEGGIDSFGREVLDSSNDAWRKMNESWDGGLTAEAYRLGLAATDSDYVAKLANLRDEALTTFREKMEAGDMDTAYPFATKSQLFSEAYQAATGTGSAKVGFKRLGIDESKVPFPDYEKGAAGESFLPATAAGKKLAEDGFDFQVSGILGNRGVTLLKDGLAVGEITSQQSDPKSASVSMVRVDKALRGSGAGLGEALYRELFSQLQKDKVELVGGMTVAPEPLAIRNKIFGGFDKLELNLEPTDIKTALSEAERIQRGTRDLISIEAVNRITPEQSFMPSDVKPKRKISAAEQDEAARLRAKYEYEPSAKSSPAKLTGWILPNQKFTPLETSYHERDLAQNRKELNKQFGTKFSETEDVAQRQDAINAGFVRVRYEPNRGEYNVELNSKFFPKQKATILNQLLDNSESIDNLRVSLLSDKGGVVDSISVLALQEMDGPEKMAEIEEALDGLRAKGGSFLPGTDFLDLGLPDEATVAQQRVKRRVSKTKENFPEAIPLRYQRNEDSEFIFDDNGKPKPSQVEYNFAETPVAKAAAKGIRNSEQRAEAVEAALADKLTGFYKEVRKNPEIKAGEKWYSTARVRLKKLFGDDAKFFSELLGATSARTPVETNFRFALDAYNQFKQGEYDSILSKYREGKTKWDKSDLADFVEETGNENPTRGQFLDWWVTENDLAPTQSNGKKFGPNSRSVLRVLDGSWASEVQGPKTPNFAGNLVGSTFEATIDVWAARALHRLANEGAKDKWRILPEMETGVTDADFRLGQAAFRRAADKLGIKPDALQAVLWFGEKGHWENNGWTRGAGAEKSDFNALLSETERMKSGTMKIRSPQLDFSLETGDIKPKKKDK